MFVTIALTLVFVALIHFTVFYYAYNGKLQSSLIKKLLLLVPIVTVIVVITFRLLGSNFSITGLVTFAILSMVNINILLPIAINKEEFQPLVNEKGTMKIGYILFYVGMFVGMFVVLTVV